MTSDQSAVSRDTLTSSEVYRQIDPAGFYVKFLRRQVRPDGRKLIAFRKVGVFDLLGDNRGSFQGFDDEGAVLSSLRLTLGATHVHCVVKAIPTYNDIPAEATSEDDNLIHVDVDLPKHVKPYIFDINGHCANLNFCISSLLENALNSEDVVPATQLRFNKLLANSVSETAVDKVSKYLVTRKLSWKLEVSVFCEEYDGNLFDVSVLATTFALRRAVLPIALLEFNESLGSYDIIPLNRQILYLASNNDPMAIKLLQQNRVSISKQINRELNEENMVTQLIGHFSGTKCVGQLLRVLALPYTITFLKFDNETFLVDPTEEEEKLGVSVSMYSLRCLDGTSRTQPLNLMGCTGLTSEILDTLEQVAADIVNYIAKTEY